MGFLLILPRKEHTAWTWDMELEQPYIKMKTTTENRALLLLPSFPNPKSVAAMNSLECYWLEVIMTKYWYIWTLWEEELMLHVASFKIQLKLTVMRKGNGIQMFLKLTTSVVISWKERTWITFLVWQTKYCHTARFKSCIDLKTMSNQTWKSGKENIEVWVTTYSFKIFDKTITYLKSVLQLKSWILEFIPNAHYSVQWVQKSNLETVSLFFPVSEVCPIVHYSSASIKNLETGILQSLAVNSRKNSTFLLTILHYFHHCYCKESYNTQTPID